MDANINAMKRSVLQRRAREMEILEGLKKITLGPLEPMRKTAPPGMEPIARLKALEDAGRKKRILRGLSVLEKVLLRKAKNQRIREPSDTYMKGHYLGMRRGTRELREKIKQEGVTPETARMLKNPEYNIALKEAANYLFTPEELEFRFREEKRISPKDHIDASSKGGYLNPLITEGYHTYFNLGNFERRVNVPPLGKEYEINLAKKGELKVKSHVSAKEIASHELQHGRTFRAGMGTYHHSLPTNEFYSFLRTLNKGYYKSAFASLNDADIDYQSHRLGSKYALIANKMGVKVGFLERLWEKKKEIFLRNPDSFANSIFKNLEWADKETKERRLSELEIKKKLRERLRDLQPE